MIVWRRIGRDNGYGELILEWKSHWSLHRQCNSDETNTTTQYTNQWFSSSNIYKGMKNRTENRRKRESKIKKQGAGPPPTQIPWIIWLFLTTRMDHMVGLFWSLLSKGVYSCFTSMYLECARGLVWPLSLWRYRLLGISSALGGLSPWLNGPTLGDCPPFSCRE